MKGKGGVELIDAIRGSKSAEQRACRNIANRLSEEAILEQLAEECGELVQQCAKRLRILRGENPTPVSLLKNYESLLEELVDVRIVIDVFGQKADIDREQAHALAAGKLARWSDRLGLAEVAAKKDLA